MGCADYSHLRRRGAPLPWGKVLQWETVVPLEDGGVRGVPREQILVGLWSGKVGSGSSAGSAPVGSPWLAGQVGGAREWGAVIGRTCPLHPLVATHLLLQSPVMVR